MDFGEPPKSCGARGRSPCSVTLFRGLDKEAWLRRGIVNGYSASPRGLTFHIAGHELHHLRILRERYLPLAGR
jgi:hypothetical protein